MTRRYRQASKIGRKKAETGAFLLPILDLNEEKALLKAQVGPGAPVLGSGLACYPG